ncbi:MAG: hypothetical protein RLZ10_1229, partial [Bacteroidota bacterium]
MNSNVINEIKRTQKLMGINSLENPLPILQEGTLITKLEARLGAKLATTIDDLFKLRSLGKIKNNYQLSLDIQKIINDFGDVLDDASKKELKALQEALEKSGKNGTAADAENILNSQRSKLNNLKVTLSNTTKQFDTLLKSLDVITSKISVAEAEALTNATNRIIEKVKDGIINFPERLRTSFPNFESYINQLRLNLSDATLEKHFPGSTPEFKNLMRKTILESVEELDELKLFYDKTSYVKTGPVKRYRPGTTSIIEELPEGISDQYRLLREKLETMGSRSLSKSELEFLDAVEKWKNGADNLSEVEAKSRMTVPNALGGLLEGPIKIPWLNKIFIKIGDWFYSVFYPWWRQWIASIRISLFGARGIENFEEVFTNRFKLWLEKGGGNIKKVDMQKIVYALEQAPSSLEGIVNYEKLYQNIWDDFVQKGRETFKGQKIKVGKELKDADTAFEDFIKEIQEFKHTGNYVIGNNKKFASFDALMTEASDEAAQSQWQAIKQSWKKANDDWKLLFKGDTSSATIWKVIGSTFGALKTTLSDFVWSYWRGGSFTTPAAFQNYIRNYYRAGGKNIRRHTMKYLLQRASATFLILPAFAGLISWVCDGVFGATADITNNEESKDYIYEGNKDYFITQLPNYILYKIFNRDGGMIELRNILNKFSILDLKAADKDENGKLSWFEYAFDTTYNVFSFMPGSTEDVAAWIVLNFAALKEGGLTPQQKAEKDARQKLETETIEKIDEKDYSEKEKFNKLKDEYGETTDSNSVNEGWGLWFQQDSNDDITNLFCPSYLIKQNTPCTRELLEKFNKTTKSLNDYINKNKVLDAGFNPAYYVGSMMALNETKRRIGQKFKGIKLEDVNDPNTTNEYAKELVQKTKDLFLKADEAPAFNRSSPFMKVKGSDGKFYIFRMKKPKGDMFDPNYIDFFTPDMDTMVRAMKDPKTILVEKGYKKQKGDENLTVIEVSALPLNDFSKYANMNESKIMSAIKKIIKEEEEKEEFKLKEWDDAFTFQKIDDKNPGMFKDVELKMRDVMERMDHWRRRYKKECEENNEKGDEGCDDGEDDSFVRAVIDTHPDVVRILVTRGLAKITTSDEKIKMEEGFAKLLKLIREENNAEVEVWSVYRHKSSPDKIWSLVKGDFKQSEMESMAVAMQKSPGNQTNKKEDTLTSLKKKELTAIENLKKNEKNGLFDLPRKLREKLQEKFSEGWTTEIPKNSLIDFYKKDTLRSSFNGDIEIYKISSPENFFKNLEKNSSNVVLTSGFCKTMVLSKKETKLNDNQKKIYEHFLNKCKDKYEER